MTKVIASLIVDINPSKAQLAFFCVPICFWIALTVSVYSLDQMLLSMLPDGNSSLLRNALIECPCSRYVIVFQGIRAETKLNKK